MADKIFEAPREVRPKLLDDGVEPGGAFFLGQITPQKRVLFGENVHEKIVVVVVDVYRVASVVGDVVGDVVGLVVN